jgi:hypothetical protein
MAIEFDPDPALRDVLTDDEIDALDPADEIGGDAAPHPKFSFPSVLVGPATSDQFNTIEEWIRPVACWRLDDTRFEFDSSFVKPGAARELRMLAEIRDDHPGATLSLFGHADPVGNDEYNKALSGRRARAIYGMLLRDVELWEKLFHGDPICPGDKWGQTSLETMLVTVERDASEAKALSGGSGASGRKELYLQYMNRLCGPRLKLSAGDFLARGSDPELRGDVQGCGEFNAVRRFSVQENKEFQQPKNKANRDLENTPNRRVVGFLFDPRLVIDGKRWPCPAATKGTGACRKRLFVNHDTRRSNQENRREFATDQDTFECRFYHRLAIQSPCEASALSVLQRLRVRLRLVYLDPMGVERPFPRGFFVEAVSKKDGTTRRTRVGNDGKIGFVIDRPSGGFFLRFDTSDDLYFASAGPVSTATPRDVLIRPPLRDAMQQGYRFFKVPFNWSTLDSDWVKVESPFFLDGTFEGIEDPSVEIGTRESPVKMVLDPHWQYLRWTYFDRAALKVVGCPPMIVEGFESAKQPASAPDTRSNWTTDGNRNQCLPWIKRDRNRPDSDVLVQLDTAKARYFAITGRDAAIKVDDEHGGPDTISKNTVDTPSIHRLRFYDLPTLWKSRGYLARLGSQVDTFEKLAAKSTSDGQPLTFSLDDIVLTDENLKPIAWDPKNDRVAIFSNKLHKGIAAGLYRPDSGVKNVSQIPAVVTDRNYLADYPDWVRLIVMRGSLHDVFDRRTADTPGGVVGARAAVRWSDGTVRGGPGFGGAPVDEAPPPDLRTMTTIAVNFEQEHITVQQHIVVPRTIGRMDQAILRCCDVESGKEIGVNLHYLRLTFDFKPDTVEPGSRQQFIDEGIEKLVRRWNGPDDVFNKGSVVLEPDDGSPLRVPVIWFAQAFPHVLSQPLVNKEAQYRIDVFKETRASLGSAQGTGMIKVGDQLPGNGGFYTLAHEAGHGDSMADEYLEDHFDCSYLQPGYRDYISGGPYFPDERSIMRGNMDVRNRHFWHSAEWLRMIYGTPFSVSYDGFRYNLPPHPDAPRQTWVSIPFVSKPYVRSGAGGFYDCWLYRLGQDFYSVKGLTHGPFDGFISVNVRMKITFFDRKGGMEDDHDDLLDYSAKIFNSVRERLNGKFFATGSVDGVKFSKVRVSFYPRLLVVNDSGDSDYYKGLNNPLNRKYSDLVLDTEADFGPTHFIVNITQTGTNAFVSNPAGAGIVTFNQREAKLTRDFPTFFGAMLGTTVNEAALNSPASFLPVVQQVMPDAQIFKLVP